MRMDFLITGGEILDPSAKTRTRADIAIVDGKIAKPESGRTYRQVIDASGCIVTPGLIDYHTHYFLNGSENGVNPDASSFCCGITTAVDGGTCGAGGYEIYRRTVMSLSEVRILNYLLVASGGQSNDRYPENLDPEFFDEEKILRLFAEYPDNLVALKTRISHSIITPELARVSIPRTVEIAQKAGVPVVVHVTDCSIPLDELADMLRPGDVICHIYHGRGENTCLGADGRVLPGLWRARERGVLFDASNGRSNFDIEVCRKAVEQGFVPDVISSDNNTSSWFLQPMHTLPRILSKFVDFGMTLEDVISAATINPAKLVKRPELGSMAVGTPADVCVFRHKRKEVPYTDINGHHFTGTQVLVPMMTFKGGKCMYCQADFC
ncbi:MAG: metallo-dependent hydrolase [Synergistaceae bacterium]|nr:metallo-dependent hydrolase [Synergistaceae bacterium]